MQYHAVTVLHGVAKLGQFFFWKKVNVIKFQLHFSTQASVTIFQEHSLCTRVKSSRNKDIVTITVIRYYLLPCVAGFYASFLKVEQPQQKVLSKNERSSADYSNFLNSNI